MDMSVLTEEWGVRKDTSLSSLEQPSIKKLSFESRAAKHRLAFLGPKFSDFKLKKAVVPEH